MSSFPLLEKIPVVGGVLSTAFTFGIYISYCIADIDICFQKNNLWIAYYDGRRTSESSRAQQEFQ